MTRKVDQIKDGVVVRTYASARVVADILKCHPQSINNACNPNNVHKTIFGYSWKYTDAEHTIEGEIWRNHSTHNLSVSNLGRVKRPSGRISRGTKNKSGYFHININRNYYSVHRLVCETFKDNTENKPTVDHIDRNRENNDINNLRWATYIEQSKNRKDNKFQ